ncbi:hypothetical protein KC19_8G199900 [Ceratodon purpureus]|uniref:Uncharacterized protein n=1 Tax=Ceratodon purpureus TaxID=3225 RepID=A0A8T0H910_CERPU|nr:hypothetical protein KC19_8G199900 [Ceratodon purpureus]
MAPSMTTKAGKDKKKDRKALGAKFKVAKKPKASSREEVERSLKIASMLLEQEDVVHSEDEGLSDDDYIRSLKVDPIAVDKGDDGFEVDKGEEGIVKVTDVKAGAPGEVKVDVVDTREKRPKVTTSLRSLRLAIAEKMKKAQDDRKAKLLAKGGFESNDEEE